MKYRGALYLLSAIIGLASLTLGDHAFAQEKRHVLPVGDSTQTVWLDAAERTYFAHVPKDLDRSKRVPLLIALHGGGSQGEGMAKMTHLNDLADEKHFIVIYPDGLEKRWNEGRVNKKLTDYDDVSFVKTLIDSLVKSSGVDPTRVYVVGISSGAFMVEKLALEIPEKLAGVGAVCCGLTDELYSGYTTDKSTNMLLILGTDDPLVPYNGGKLSDPIVGGKGKVYSANQMIAFWAGRNDCSSDVDTDSPDVKSESDTTRVTKSLYSPKKNGKALEVIVVHGGGHTWPSGPQYLPVKKIGPTTQQISNEDIWEFFQDKRL